MKYLIDTDICIYILNKHPIKIIQKFRSTDPGDIGVSSITVAELQFGISKSMNKKKNQQRLDAFLTPLQIVSFDFDAVKYYGNIRDQLEKEGKRIGPLDMLIAAIAIQRNLIVITKNGKEYKRIKS